MIELTFVTFLYHLSLPSRSLARPFYLSSLMKFIWIPQSIALCMFLAALLDTHYYNFAYEYYIILRWVACAIFAYLATEAYQQGKSEWVWILGFFSGLYNPFVPVELTREIWFVINILTIIVALGSIIALSRNSKNKKSSN